MYMIGHHIQNNWVNWYTCPNLIQIYGEYHTSENLLKLWMGVVAFKDNYFVKQY
jgi:hypothetical protein